MKVALFFMFACVFQLYAFDMKAQNSMIELSTSTTTVEKFFSEIEKQTGCLVIYDNNQLSGKTIVKLSEKRGRVYDMLNEFVKGTNLKYEITNKYIVFSKASNRASQNTKTIKGVVRDEKGEPIIGANIHIVGTTTGTITDIDGNFALEVPANGKLEITYIGYQAQEMSINNRNSFTITLKEDAETLDEVVVIGYGTQKKSDLTGAVANITTSKLTTQSNTNIMNALQGKLAGVDIVSQGGMPGSGSRIMVRGIGTMNNSTPLYIVDGIYMGAIDHINPNDIQSIDILKDASASAIYGSRAANGVVIVTTKSGSESGGIPQIDFSLNVGIQSPEKYLKMLNAAQWAEVTTAARAAAGKAMLDMAKDIETKEDNDWQKVIMGSALMQNYNVSVRGGNKGYTYYVGLGYLNQEGTMKSTNYERMNVQAKSDYKRGWFSFGHNLLLQTSNTGRPNTSTGNTNESYLGITLFSVPTLDRFDDTRLGGYGHTYGDVFNNFHPLACADKDLSKNKTKSYTVDANLYAQIEIPIGLKYKFSLTPTYSFSENMGYNGLYDTGLRRNDMTSLNRSTSHSSGLLVEHLLSYDKSIGNHKISALLGYSYQDNKYRYLAASGTELPEDIYEITAATSNRNNDGNSNRATLTSVLSRVFYSYNNKYLFTATLRRDGSSRFASNNRYGYFPAFSLGWNLAEESFMKKYGWLDQLKLRGGYGVLGNQEIGNYQYLSVVTSGLNYPNASGSLDYGSFPKTFASPSIKWEETTMTNIGVDFQAFKNRLSFTGEYYIKNTKDILLTVPIPVSTGGSNDPIRNAGKIKNSGFEFSLAWRDRANKDFSYEASIVGNIMKNEVTQMGTGTQILWGGDLSGSTWHASTTKTFQGYPIGGFWLLPTDGLFQSDEEVQKYNKDGVLILPNAKAGDIKFRDTNDDGKINDDDRIYKGSPFPSFTMGLNLSAQWRGFDMMMGLQGNFGNKIYNATKAFLENTTSGINYLATTYDYWTPQNTDATYPRLTWNDPNRNLRPESDRNLEDGSYVRLRNVQIGYTVPKIIKGLNKCRIYISMENLFTITKYSGYTPDVNTGNSMSRGMDNFTYPLYRTFMLGLNVGI